MCSDGSASNAQQQDVGRSISMAQHKQLHSLRSRWNITIPFAASWRMELVTIEPLIGCRLVRNKCLSIYDKAINRQPLFPPPLASLRDSGINMQKDACVYPRASMVPSSILEMNGNVPAQQCPTIKTLVNPLAWCN